MLKMNVQQIRFSNLTTCWEGAPLLCRAMKCYLQLHFRFLLQLGITCLAASANSFSKRVAHGVVSADVAWQHKANMVWVAKESHIPVRKPWKIQKNKLISVFWSYSVNIKLSAQNKAFIPMQHKPSETRKSKWNTKIKFFANWYI